jgi:acetyltransferase-like isoleucine patch superfamily enzyme
MRIFRILKTLRNRYEIRMSPINYAKRIGVNFDEKEVKLYGTIRWGSEPWMITLGKNVFITHNVAFVTHDGGTLPFRRLEPTLEISKPITVGDNVFIGINTVVLPGVNIGNNVVIGAGSVVAKDIPDNSLAAGNPARVIKTADEYFEKLKKESLGFGHLSGKEKDIALRKYYNYNNK